MSFLKERLLRAPRLALKSAGPVAALLEWAQSSDFRAEPGRMYVHDGVVVVEEAVTSGEGSTTAAAAFRVVRDHITSVFRHPDLATALAATELSEKDLAG